MQVIGLTQIGTKSDPALPVLINGMPSVAAWDSVEVLYMNIYIYIYEYIYIYIYIYMCVCVYICMQINVNMYICFSFFIILTPRGA